MLQFILGKPSSGKTYTVLEKIKYLSQNGKKCVLIVPEQFTFESERSVLETLGDKAVLNTEVLSFTRLCDEVGRNTGGIAGRVLNDYDKAVFMKRALALAEDGLKIWQRYTNSLSFSKTMLDTAGEFKINAVSPMQLRQAAEDSGKPTLKLKLCDTALIMENYDAVVGEKFIDPADSLTKLYNSLLNFRYFEGKTVFIDSFKGFTGQQYKIIERILAQAENVYISLTDDINNKNEYSIYTNIRKAQSNIKRIAKTHNVQIKQPMILEESRYKNKGIAAVERLISSAEDEFIDDDGSVNICRAATPADEAEYAAKTIRRLVRQEGYRYRDFVIIARKSEKYADLVASACKRNGISLFYDKRIPLSCFPIAAAGESAINALSFSSEDILRFHKTGLGTLSTDEIAVLENYVYIWNIDGGLWLKEWDMNPDGLKTEEESEEDSSDRLKQLNELRSRAVKPISEFKENFRGSASQMAGALVKLFGECGVSETLAEMCGKLGDESDFFQADALKQSADEYMKILDSIVSCFENQKVSIEEFSETLNLAVDLADIGVIPQTLDQVTFGSADRIRPSRPKVAFILGANQGVFPQSQQNTGVFNTSERKILIENGINIADNSVYSSIDEEFLVYCSLCCPSEKLYISYYEQSVSGEKAEPSTFLGVITSNSNLPTVSEPEKQLTARNAPETENAAFGEYCRRVREDLSGAVSLKEALCGTASYDRINFIEQAVKETEKKISPQTARELYGQNIGMSASRLDTFNRCRFSYFCRYGLKIKKLQPADFDVMQRGTIVHFVLERLISEHGQNIGSLLPDELNTLTEKYIDEYFSGITGFKSVMSARTEFLISRITRSLKEVVQHIAKELSQSEFKPDACELKIGENNSLSFKYDKGEIRIYGSIDRVDKYNGYIRVIDYKTGSKNFKLPDVLFGLNLQMLIYLYAVTRGAGLDDSAAAGILYQPAKRNTADNNMAMNGLLQSDEKLYAAMDKDGKGEFIPVLSFNKDGSISKKCASYIEKEGFTAIFDYIEKIMKKTGNAIASGDIKISPLDGRESPACKYRDFFFFFGIEDREVPRVPDLKNDEILDAMKEGEKDGV